MLYFLNGGRNERDVLKLPESLALYKKLGVTKLAIIPYAIMEEEWQRIWQQENDLFGIPGLEVKALTIFDTDEALINKTVGWADFIYLPGGAQKTLLRRMRELGTDRYIHEAIKLDRLKLIGGGSAGAMVMGSQCIVGRRDVEEVVEGLNFLPSAIVDSHFSNRDRESRLTGVLHDHKPTTGIGIDENTAAVLDGQLALQQVFGTGTVSIYRNNEKETYDSNSKITQ